MSERFGDVRDLLIGLPYGDPEGATRYVELDLFPVRHEIIRKLEPAPRSVFEFGALYGYFLVTALDAAPSIRSVGWVDDESHTPGSNALCMRNVLAARERGLADAVSYVSRGDVPPGLQYDLVQVDGDHSVGGCLADLNAALLLEPRWIMVDDWEAHAAVRAACAAWLRTQRDGLWALTEHDTVNGLAMLTRSTP